MQLLPDEPVSETDDAFYYHGFKLDNIVFSCLHYIQFRMHGQIWWGKIHSIWVTKAGKKKMVEVQPFRNVPSDQRRTDYEEYDELYSVVGETMDIPASSVLPYECRLVWVPPHVADDQLITYVEENIGKPEYDDDKRNAKGGSSDEDDNDYEDELGNFIVEGDRWGFYQYATTTKNNVNSVEYSPSPQFIDLAMSTPKDTVARDDWHSSELCTYIFTHFIKPKYPELSTYAQCKENSRIDGFMTKLREMLSREERDLTSMYALCLSVQYG